MTKSFGEYLKQLRLSVKPKKLSQQCLGTAINSTRQYIDAIEKSTGKTTPPRYALLIKLVRLLSLNKDQTNKLLWLAFTERIQSNWDLYTYLHSEKSALLKRDNINTPLTYAITFTASSNLSEQVQSQIKTSFTKKCSPYEMISLIVNKKTVSLILGLSLNHNVQNIITQLKAISSPVQWQSDVQIQTIGNIPAESAHFTVTQRLETTVTP
jgi:hypothetical protein